jgi:hypothetical protein
VLTDEQRAAAATALEPRLKQVLEAQDAEGRWVTTTGGDMPGKAPRVDMGTFERNMKVLSDYLKLTRKTTN